MSDLDDPIYKEIVTARVKLLLEKSFFGNLASRLIAVEAPWCSTAATEGKHLFYNREFIKGLNRPQLLFLIAHEVLHVVFDHIGRRGGRDKDLWNMACLNWGTPILMADGTWQPIQRVLPGDMIASPTGPTRVLGTMFSGIKPTCEFSVGDRKVRATLDHQFAAVGSNAFLQAAEMGSSLEHGFVLRDLPHDAEQGPASPARLAQEDEFIEAVQSAPTIYETNATHRPVLMGGTIDEIGDRQIAARAALEAIHGDMDEAALAWASRRVEVQAGVFFPVDDSNENAPVFDIITESGSYFANGVLVHNCDYIINYVLVKEKVGQMPEGGLYDEKYTDEMTAYEVYELLKKNSVTIKMPLDEHLDVGADQEEGDGSGDQDGDSDGDQEGDGQGDGPPKPGNGGGKSATIRVLGKDGPPVLSEADLNKIRNQFRAALVQTAQSVGAGNVPLGVRRMIQQLIDPQLDWRSLLDAHVRSAVKDDYTFQRISRRSWGIGAILPAQDFMDRVEIFCAIDASGSTTQEMVTDFLSEVKGITDSWRDYKIDVVSFDTEVYNHVILTPENVHEVYEYEIKGGGGTMFEAVYEYLKRNGIEPHRLAFLTDGLPNSTWGDPNYSDTIFIIHSNPRIFAPYGLTAHYEPKPNRNAAFMLDAPTPRFPLGQGA